MLDSIDFAKYVLWRTQELQRQRNIRYPIGPAKLNTIMYICEGILLAYGINIIKEHAQAWDCGPIYPRVFKWFSDYHGFPAAVSVCSEEIRTYLEKYKAIQLIDRSLIALGTRTDEELTAWSRGKSSPWEQALQAGHGLMSSPIDKHVMARYFAKLHKR
ncbi:MAG: SocA family protein [Treponema sp.]|jgi:uncharacterized phage-associated protein|nr:SocA family protein [Treponema sp.]